MRTDIRVAMLSQAYLAVHAETYDFPGIETGGILLGRVVDRNWYIIEAIDPGYRNVHRSHGYFEYDVEYVNHLANTRSRLYESGLELLGLWHRHPGSLDRFSSTDDYTNERFAQSNRRGALSALVNLDPHFRITFYHVTIPLQYQSVSEVVTGDSFVPLELYSLRDPSRRRIVSDRSYNIVEKTGFWGSVGQWATKTTDRILGLGQQEANGGEFMGQDSDGQESVMDDSPVMDMLESEMETYLDLQRDYTYTMQMVGNAIEITMKYIGNMPEYPRKIVCSLSKRDGENTISINGHCSAYAKGALQRFVNQCVASFHEIPQDESQFFDDPFEQECLKLLGIKRPYTQKGIRDAYRLRIKDVHPDTWAYEKNSSLQRAAAQETAKLNTARDYLMNKQSRSQETISQPVRPPRDSRERSTREHPTEGVDSRDKERNK